MTTAGTERREDRPEVRPPRRVVLLSQSVGLGALLKYLLGASGTLTRFAQVGEAANRDGFADADTVVLDLPQKDADVTLAQVRHRYRGELVVIAERGQGRPEAAPEPAWTLLERPFTAVDLGTALGLPGVDAATAPGPKADRHPPVDIRTPRPLPPALAGPADGGAAAADAKAAARRSPTWIPFEATGRGQTGLAERASRVVAMLTQGREARRRGRVAGFSVVALVAFTVAFALAAQSGRCGPGCDAFGTVFSPDPTVAPSESRAPSTTGPKRSTTTAAVRAADPPGTGSFRGITGGGRLATTTTTQARATTTSQRPSSSSTAASTTRPTRPPTTPPTTAPPTTAPPTTAPPTTLPPPGP